MTTFGLRRVSVWHVYLVWGIAVALLYLMVPPFKGNGWMMPLLSMS